MTRHNINAGEDAGTSYLGHPSMEIIDLEDPTGSGWYSSDPVPQQPRGVVGDNVRHVHHWLRKTSAMSEQDGPAGVQSGKRVDVLATLATSEHIGANKWRADSPSTAGPSRHQASGAAGSNRHSQASRDNRSPADETIAGRGQLSGYEAGVVSSMEPLRNWPDLYADSSYFGSASSTHAGQEPSSYIREGTASPSPSESHSQQETADALDEQYGNASSQEVLQGVAYHEDVLVCEFGFIGECQQTFTLGNQIEWIEHVVQHMKKIPSISRCWFCDEYFEVSEDSSEIPRKIEEGDLAARRLRNFQDRLRHIADHLYRGYSINDAMPDVKLFEYLRRNKIVTESRIQWMIACFGSRQRPQKHQKQRKHEKHQKHPKHPKHQKHQMPQMHQGRESAAGYESQHAGHGAAHYGDAQENVWGDQQGLGTQQNKTSEGGTEKTRDKGKGAESGQHASQETHQGIFNYSYPEGYEQESHYEEQEDYYEGYEQEGYYEEHEQEAHLYQEGEGSMPSAEGQRDRPDKERREAGGKKSKSEHRKKGGRK